MVWIVISAAITATASLIVAIISITASARNSRRVAVLTSELEKQKLHLASELEEQKDARQARRDYEYDARKRLYTECEPVVFQAIELAALARNRVLSLARSCRQGDLRPDGTGWLSTPGYYFRSTAHLLLAPMTSFKILQRRLTTIDLSLEPRLQTQYELMKILFVSFTDDHALARIGPSLEYDPDRADPGKPDREKLLQDSPAIYRRQGFYLGTLDEITEAMIEEGIRGGTAISRCKTFGEFQKEWNTSDSAINSLIPVLVDLFTGFHPIGRPALWRVLTAQFLLYGVFLSAHRDISADKRQITRLAVVPSTSQLTALDWRSDPAAAGADEVRQPLNTAHAYLRKKLAEVELNLHQSQLSRGLQ